MIAYVNFYIDTDTHQIHEFGCNDISTGDNIYLGIYRNIEIALTKARSIGYINASICKSCNSFF